MNINKTVLFAGVTRVEKKDVSSERVAYNLGLAVTDGYGENEKPIYYNAVLFAKHGKQEEYYDNIVVKGAQLPFVGKIVPGKAYKKDGVEIKPWVFQIQGIDNGINQVFLSGRLTADAVVSMQGDRVIVRYTIAVDKYKKDEANFIHCVQFGKGGFSEYAKKYLTKGKKVTIAGEESTDSYINSSGAKVYTQEIIVREIGLNSSCQTGKASPAYEEEVPDVNGMMPNYDDEEGGDEPLPY